MTKTKPENIQDPCYREIWRKLKEDVQYPCTIVVYGPERAYRTTFRGEHHGVFGIDVVHSAEEAWNIVDCGYVGWPGDLNVYIIQSGDEAIRIN